MIQVTLFTQDKHIYRLRLEGHAGFAAHGEDIVCSAVSMLVMNTINSIEKFTDEPLEERHVNSKRGLIDIIFPRRKQGIYEPEAELLIKSMLHGLMTVQEMYGEKYIQIQLQ